MANGNEATYNKTNKVSLEQNAEGRPRFRGCSSIKKYEVLGKLGEGTFGEVHKARSIQSGRVVALKKILMHNEKDGFPITALREIKLLKILSHPHVLKLEEMAVERSKLEGRKKAIMYMVTQYMDHDLSGLLENPAVHITEPQIKCYMLQLLEGLRYLHSNKILHRDMKAANLLINNRGILQIADFGLARPYDDPPPRPGEGGGEATRDYTTLVVTRWYRPPELLLQLRRYTTAIDMWGVGCVFGEMFKGRPILAGNTDLNQAQMIFDLVGAPTEETMPGWSSLPGCEGITSFAPRVSTLSQVFREQGSAAISLLSDLLRLDWRKRINAIDALEHPYFRTSPLPAKPGDLPKFEESHELDRRKFRDKKAALPPAPAGGTVGVGPVGEWGNGSGPQTHQFPRRHPGPPLGHSRNNFDTRLPHALPPNRGGPPTPQSQDRRLVWQRETMANSLPPRPPAPQQAWHGWSGETLQDLHRSRPPGHTGRPPAHGNSRVDTYIPSYGGSNDNSRIRNDDTWQDERATRVRHTQGRDYDQGPRRSRSPPRWRDTDRPRERDRDTVRY
ncbi:serine/threonine protein kinase, CMGC, CDC2/CDK sub [Bachmanniomyces sp. S44760]|nr:serine/threonine protein kinase, CMGC, CDC2/CDK sub [Bachmanniomyces sp. S44760]